jgi:hypothetical protein
VTTNQVFELLFLTEVITPAHAALLLLFFGAIPRDMDAEALMKLTHPTDATTVERQAPFLLTPEPTDDESITALQAYFEALHYAYRLNVTVSVDA